MILAVVLVTSCATLPTSGPVVEAGAADEDQTGLVFIAPGPGINDTPVEIVQGFLRAAAEPASEYAKPQQFLNEATAQNWNPSAGTVVYDPTSATVEVLSPLAGTSSVHVQLTAVLVGKIDEFGRYEVTEPGEKYTVTYTLTQREDSQWRISEAPSGLALSTSILSVAYNAYNVYFYDPGYTTLIPDVRWFPRREAIATTIVRAMLHGPAPYLEAGVRSAIPLGTQLVTPAAVTIENGAPIVDFTEPVRDSTAAARQLIRDQLNATLSPLPGVTESVSIRVKGARIDVPTGGQLPKRPMPQSAVAAVITAPSPENAQLVLYQPDLQRVSSTETLALPVADAAYPAFGLTTDTQVPWFVILAANNTRLSRVARHQPPVDLFSDGLELLPPSVDQFGWTWTAHPGDKQLIAISEQGEVAMVPLPWLAEGGVRGLRVSPEGRRVAVTAGSAEAVETFVGGVARGVQERPESVPNSKPIGKPSVGISRVYWVSSDMVAVFGSGVHAESAPQRTAHLRLLSVSGLEKSHETLPETTRTIAIGESVFTAVVQRDDGTMQTKVGSRWRPALVGIPVRSIGFAG